jgi:hypothetical protein
MPAGHTGAIIRGSQMLMERPKALSDQARAEEKQKAIQQTRDRDQSLMGHKANLKGAMPDGFAMGGRYRGAGANVKMSIDPGIDIPMPQHQVGE